jgi:hypothetical protein
LILEQSFGEIWLLGAPDVEELCKLVLFVGVELILHDELKLHSNGEGYDPRLRVYWPVDSEKLRDRHLIPGVYLRPYHIRGEKESLHVRHYLELGQLEVTQQLSGDGLKREVKTG